MLRVDIRVGYTLCVPWVDPCPFGAVVMWRAVPWQPPIGRARSHTSLFFSVRRTFIHTLVTSGPSLPGGLLPVGALCSVFFSRTESDDAEVRLLPQEGVGPGATGATPAAAAVHLGADTPPRCNPSRAAPHSPTPRYPCKPLRAHTSLSM